MRKLWLLALLLFSPLAWGQIISTTNNVSFTCTGATGPFPFAFPAYDSGAMTVIQTTGGIPTTLVPTAQYTILPVNNSYINGGSVTLATSCPVGSTLTLQRDTEETQLYVFQENMPALYQTFQSSLDKLTMEVQDLDGKLENETVLSITPGTGIACTPLVNGICVGQVTVTNTGGGGGSGTVTGTCSTTDVIAMWVGANAIGCSPIAYDGTSTVTITPGGTTGTVVTLQGGDGASVPISASPTGGNLYLNSASAQVSPAGNGTFTGLTLPGSTSGSVNMNGGTAGSFNLTSTNAQHFRPGQLNFDTLCIGCTVGGNIYSLLQMNTSNGALRDGQQPQSAGFVYPVSSGREYFGPSTATTYTVTAVSCASGTCTLTLSSSAPANNVPIKFPASFSPSGLQGIVTSSSVNSGSTVTFASALTATGTGGTITTYAAQSVAASDFYDPNDSSVDVHGAMIPQQGTSYTPWWKMTASGMVAGGATGGPQGAGTINMTGCYVNGVACGGGSSGFPITLGSTSIAASSTTTAVTGLSVNGVTLNAAGSSSLFLNQAGGYTAPAGGGSAFCAINNQTASYTLVLADGVASGNACLGTITMTNASSTTVTVPTNASVAFPIVDEIDVAQLGVGQVCFVAAGGVSLPSPTSLCARAQNSVIGIRKIATNTWVVFGDTQ